METVSDVSSTSYEAPIEAADSIDEARRSPVRASSWLRPPRWVWVVAVLAAAIHMAPYLRALAETPEGYEFSANLSLSPDYMQYRVWMRQTQVEGPIVRDLFTTEPNTAHLPVPLYWMLGKLATWSGITPEWTYAWFGAVLAVVFTLVVYATARRFLPGARARAWAFGTLMLGGGLGGYLELLAETAWARGSFFMQFLLLRPMREEGGAVLFEAYRGNYIIQALFDTHFLAYWLLTTLAVLSLHSAVRTGSRGRLAATAALFAFATFLHIYEGLTLLAISWGALAVIAVRGAATRRTLVTTAVVCTGAIVVTLLPILVVAKQAGLPTPGWRGESVAFSVFVLAYPLALGLIVWGFGRYWRGAGLEEAFLVGWGVACAAIVLSGPFFPYPDRGTLTLQIPLFLIAVAIWFGRRERVGAAGTAIVVLLLGSTPLWIARGWVERTRFDVSQAHKWTGPAHQAIVSVLDARASRDDVLVADQTNLRWLAPRYPGVHYAGHFFLTVDFRRKQDALQRFYESADAMERRAFLDRWGARWLFVDDAYEVDPFTRVPGVSVVARTPAGTLLEVAPRSPSAQ
jgi:hypothetical protein